MRENLATVLEVVADVLPDHVAIEVGELRVTWAELDERAARLAAWFNARGIGRDDRVGIGLYNGREYLETVLALFKLRSVPVNLNYRYREDELEYVLRDAGAVGAVVDASLLDRARKVSTRLPGLATLLVVGAAYDEPADHAVDFEQAMRSDPAPRIDRGDDSWLLYTGGTTGAPKGVEATHAWLFQTLRGGSFAALGEDPPTSLSMIEGTLTGIRERHGRVACLVAPPLMHGTGIYSALGTLLVGGTVVLLPSRSFDAASLASELVRSEATDLVIVGDVFGRPLVDELDEARRRGRPYLFHSLRRVRSIGATWSAEVKRRLLTHGDLELRDIVAASEGGGFAVALTTRADEAETNAFRLAPGARLLDDDDRDVVPGSGVVGRLAAPAREDVRYRGGDPSATYRVIGDQRYCIPGDLATLDADGTLRFQGRGSRVINSGGEKIFAEEVETLLASHPDVHDACVVGVAHPRFGQRVAAAIVPRDGRRPDPAALSDHVAAKLADHKRPRLIVFVDDIARQPSGKLDLESVAQELRDEDQASKRRWDRDAVVTGDRS